MTLVTHTDLVDNIYIGYVFFKFYFMMFEYDEDTGGTLGGTLVGTELQ